jgi:hypothetical protein
LFVFQLILFGLRGKNRSDAIMKMVFGEDEIPQDYIEYFCFQTRENPADDSSRVIGGVLCLDASAQITTGSAGEGKNLQIQGTSFC